MFLDQAILDGGENVVPQMQVVLVGVNQLQVIIPRAEYIHSRGGERRKVLKAKACVRM
jgi:hypothetical protein